MQESRQFVILNMLAINFTTNANRFSTCRIAELTLRHDYCLEILDHH